MGEAGSRSVGGAAETSGRWQRGTGGVSRFFRVRGQLHRGRAFARSIFGACFVRLTPLCVETCRVFIFFLKMRVCAPAVSRAGRRSKRKRGVLVNCGRFSAESKSYPLGSFRRVAGWSEEKGHRHGGDQSRARGRRHLDLAQQRKALAAALSSSYLLLRREQVDVGYVWQRTISKGTSQTSR